MTSHGIRTSILLNLFFLLAFPLYGATEVELNTLMPTQFAVGMREVSVKEDSIRGLSGAELDAFLQEEHNVLPVVKGPQDRLYVTDHHHLAVALLHLKKTKAYVEVIEDFSKLSEEDFWNAMTTAPYVYLRDENGKMRKREDLPKQMSGLKDDPYRSLVYFVKKAKGFKKTDDAPPYMEFEWVEFFRAQPKIKIGKTDKEFRAAVDQAVILAHSDAAKDLPGHRKNK